MDYPSFEDFCCWSDEKVAHVAPETMVFAPAGTRRRALIEGVSKEEYSSWAIQELGESVPLFFKSGVKNVIVPLLGPRQLQDPNLDYRNHVIEWISQQVTSKELKSLSREYKYRLRLIGPATYDNERLYSSSENLKEYSGKLSKEEPVLWMYVVQREEDPWNEIVRVIKSNNVEDRSGISRVLYGENIPPARLYIGFGRLALHPNIIPLVLFNNDIHCYWTTKAGFRISSESFRKIMYDFVYSRSRGAEYAERYKYINELKDYWNSETVIGLGVNIHGFWLPQTKMEG